MSLLARRLGTGAACAASSTLRALSVPLVARGGTLLAAERAARSDLTSGSARFAGACIGAMPTFVLAAAVLISAITWAIAIARRIIPRVDFRKVNDTFRAGEKLVESDDFRRK